MLICSHGFWPIRSTEANSWGRPFRCRLPVRKKWKLARTSDEAPSPETLSIQLRRPTNMSPHARLQFPRFGTRALTLQTPQSQRVQQAPSQHLNASTSHLCSARTRQGPGPGWRSCRVLSRSAPLKKSPCYQNTLGATTCH